MGVLIEPSAAAASSYASLPTTRRFGWWEVAALSLFTFTVGFCIHFHEPWADEAQAWLMARDLGLWDLLAHGVRYEGTPGLWHLLLWMLVRLNVSFQGMHWISGLIAVAGAAVWLKFSSFPRWLRLLVPFTFFLAYQNAVVARSYVLFPLLTFAAAALLCSKQRRPLVLAIVLGLLANLSVHGLVEAAGLALAALLLWRKPAAGARKISVLAPLALLGGMMAVAVGTALPPADVDFPAGVHMQKSLNGKHDTSRENLTSSAELKPLANPIVRKTKAEKLETDAIRLLAEIAFPLSEFRWIALLMFVLLMTRAIGGSLAAKAALIPYILMVLVFWRIYLAPRHAGMLYVSFLVAAWLSWPAAFPLRRWARVREVALLVLLAFTTVEQVRWMWHALTHDARWSYSGGPAVADYLRPHVGNSRIAGFYFHPVDVLPDFDHNIYFNQPNHAYWLWSNRLHINSSAPMAIAQHPDFVVLGGWNWGDQSMTSGWSLPEGTLVKAGEPMPLADSYGIADYLLKHGYRETHRFCGRAWMRTGFAEELCDVVWEPAAKATAMQKTEAGE